MQKVVICINAVGCVTPPTGSDKPALVVSRLSHRELRDLEWASVVGPAEWQGLAVVVLDEGDDAVGELVAARELAVTEQPSFMIDKNSSTWLSHHACVGVVQEHVRVVVGNSPTLAVPCAERLSMMQCRSSKSGV